MALYESLFGKPGGWEQTPLGYTPEQTGAMNNMLSRGQQGMQNPTAGFEPIAANARTNFQQRTMPSLMERITSGGLGGGNSAFGQMAAQAGRGLEGDLAAQEKQYGQTNMANLNNMMNMGLQRQYGSMYNQREPGLLQQYAQGQLEQGSPGDLFSSFTGGGQKNPSWMDTLGSAGSAAATGAGVAGPWGALAGLIPLFARMFSGSNSPGQPVNTSQANMIRQSAARQQ